MQLGQSDIPSACPQCCIQMFQELEELKSIRPTGFLPLTTYTINVVETEVAEFKTVERIRKEKIPTKNFP